MRILCLHGNGTNSEVLKSQSAPLRHELEDDGIEFDFVEAALPAPPSTIVQGIEALSSPDRNFYGFYDPDDLSTLPPAVSQLDEFVATEGPYDGVLGFSAGAVLSALYLAETHRQGRPAPFRFGIFVASAVSAHAAAYLGLRAEEGPAQPRISIPTLHVWGSNDTTAPTGGRDVCQMCDPARRLAYVHDGGHEFPRKEHLTAAAQAVRRTIREAERS